MCIDSSLRHYTCAGISFADIKPLTAFLFWQES